MPLPAPPLPGVAFPPDLRVWLGEDRLLRLALEAAAQHADGCATFPAEGSAEGSWAVPSLVALTVFSYLTGRYGSEDIAEEAESDPALRYLCAGRFPSATELRRFRRSHRPVLGAAMRSVLAAAAEFRLAHAWLGSGTGSCPPQGRGGRPVGVDLCREAAEARLLRAALADTMALDG